MPMSYRSRLNTFESPAKAGWLVQAGNCCTIGAALITMVIIGFEYSDPMTSKYWLFVPLLMLAVGIILLLTAAWLNIFEVPALIKVARKDFGEAMHELRRMVKERFE